MNNGTFGFFLGIDPNKLCVHTCNSKFSILIGLGSSAGGSMRKGRMRRGQRKPINYKESKSASEDDGDSDGNLPRGFDF